MATQAPGGRPGTSAPGPGWYPDPMGHGERYWNGNAWTSELRAVPSPTVTAPAAASPDDPARTNDLDQRREKGSGFSREMTLAAVGAALLGLGVFLPWAKAPFESVNGLERLLPWLVTGVSENSNAEDTFIAHGWLFLALAALILLQVFTRRLPGGRTTIALAAAAALGLTVADFVRFRQVWKPLTGVSVGIGLYVSGLGAALVLGSVAFGGDRVRESRQGRPSTTGRRSYRPPGDLMRPPAPPTPAPPEGPGRTQAASPTPSTPKSASPADTPSVGTPRTPPPPSPGPPQAPPRRPDAPGSAGRWWKE